MVLAPCRVVVALGSWFQIGSLREATIAVALGASGASSTTSLPPLSGQIKLDLQDSLEKDPEGAWEQGTEGFSF